MTEKPAIFVPIIHIETASLYKVIAYPADFDFQINYSSLSFNNGLKQIYSKFNIFFQQEDFNLQIIIQSEKNNTKLKPDLITESTQSIVLGLLCEAYRLLKHRTYKHKWDSITITGDIYNDTGTARFHSVESIQTKFQVVKEYAEQNPLEKHSFIYVNESEIQFDNYPENLFIFHFDEASTFEAFFAEVFEPDFDEKQKALLRNIPVTKTWDFVETDFYRKLKNECLTDKWKGTIITGEGETGKSATAYELCKYLMANKKVYAPVWLLINESDFFKSLSQGSINKDDDNSFVYLQQLISKVLKINIESIQDVLKDREYVFVIDNLESNNTDLILNAIQDLYDAYNLSPYTIITSRSEEISELQKRTGYAHRHIKSLDEKNFNEYVHNLIKVKKWEAPWSKEASTLKEKFLKEIYNQFSMYPGIIPQIITELRNSTLNELYNQIKETKSKNINLRIEKIIIFNFIHLDFLTQLVFFAFIELNQFYRHLDKNFGNKEIVEELTDSIFKYPGLISIENVENSMNKLFDTNMLISDEAGIEIKSSVLHSLLFTQNLSGELKLARICLITTSAKAQYAVEWNFPDELQDLLPELKINEIEELFKICLCYDYYKIFDLLLNELCHKKNKKIISSYLLSAASYGVSAYYIKQLINCGADWKYKKKYGPNLLECSILNSNTEILNYVLQNKYFIGDINSRDDIGLLPLEEAALLARNPDVITILEEYGADPKLVDNSLIAEGKKLKENEKKIN